MQRNHTAELQLEIEEKQDRLKTQKRQKMEEVVYSSPWPLVDLEFSPLSNDELRYLNILYRNKEFSRTRAGVTYETFVEELQDRYKMTPIQIEFERQKRERKYIIVEGFAPNIKFASLKV